MLVYPVTIIDVLLNRLTEMAQDFQNSDTLPVRVAAELADIRRSQNGEPEAYRRLIEAHQQYVGQLLWRFARDTAVHEELVQDVFVEAYFSLHSYKGKAPFAHWLARIATRVGYRYWKKADARTGELTFEEWDRVASVDKHDTTSEAGEMLFRLLGQLPPRDRLVLTLRYVDECDVAEVAHRTGWTQTMVKVQTLRAKAKLKKLFDLKQKEMAK
jgi:RNA polymerase sigma-70 factor, ECF subfamily